MEDARDNEPQGGYDVLCWRVPNGVGHRFDDDISKNWGPSGWIALCGASLEDGFPDLDTPMDCMTCIVLEARRAAD